MNNLKVFRLTVSGNKGESEEILLPEIDGIVLMPRSDLIRLFNVSPSTVNQWFREKVLNRYAANGKQKTERAGDRTATYINLREFLTTDLKQSKPTINIK